VQNGHSHLAIDEKRSLTFGRTVRQP
jgi:hypothetical protein